VGLQKPDAGYTLAELLVVTALVGLLMGAVFGVYEISQRQYGIASAGEEALLFARTALERIASDLRMAGAGWTRSQGVILVASSTTITFLGDINGDTLDSRGFDATLAADAPHGATLLLLSSGRGFSVHDDDNDFPGEFLQIADGAVQENRVIAAVAGRTLTLAAGLSTRYPAGSSVRSVETVTYSLDATGVLRRTVGGSGAQPFASHVQSFTLTYWDGGDPPRSFIPASQADRDAIRQITVKLTVLVPSGGSSIARTIESSVRPRNLLQH